MNSDEADLLLNQLNTEGLGDKVGLMIARLMSEAVGCEIIAFQTFYVPLLSKILRRVDKNPAIGQVYRRLFQHVLSIYILRYVQIAPQASTWERSPEGCGCSICAKLDAFLVNPNEQSRNFPGLSKSQRHHVHLMLNDTNHTHETDRSAFRDTLVVTKCFDNAHAQYDHWKRKFAAAHKDISDMDNINQEILKLLLSDEYEDTTQLLIARKGTIGHEARRRNKRRRMPEPESIDLT